MISSNKERKENAEKRRELAFQEWSVYKKRNIKKIALKYKTDPTKFKEYIINKGHSFDTANYYIFDNIDTEEKAYWLGFLYADGYVSKTRNEIELSLQKSDIDHIRKFKKFMSAEQEIKINLNRCRLIITNNHLKESLIKHGCGPVKSRIIRFPNLSEDLHRHFVRGYFDGDGTISRSISGSIWNTAAIFSGSEKFMEDLKKILNLKLEIHHLKVRRMGSTNVYGITFTNKSFVKLMFYLYEDSKISLNRKLERANDSTAVYVRDHIHN